MSAQLSIGGVVALCCLLGATASPAAPRPNKSDHELTIVPAAGGDSDVGIGGGYLAAFARLDPRLKPYLFRLEAAGSITFKPTPAGSWDVPYADDYLKLEAPHVIPNRLKFEVRLSYTREQILKFYGLGNASRIPAGADPNAARFEHGRTHPTLSWLATYHVTPSVDLQWGTRYTQNWLSVPSEGQLADTLRNGSAVERELLGSARDHGTPQLTFGAAWDGRDNELNAEHGQYHSLNVDLAPAGTQGIPHQWARVDAATRFYLPLVRSRLTFAFRVLGDLLFGDAPFYELPRQEDTYFGGGKGVRGVPAQRYWGKVKLLSNSELRSKLVAFDLWGEKNWLGVTAFFDAGRVWADYRAHPELDGTGVGLKWGVGGGPRLLRGKSFVLRLDVAYSPDASPVGGYLTAGQVF